MEVYIVNKMIRELSPRGCLRELSRWIFGRKALETEGITRATYIQRGEQPGKLRE